MAPDRDGDNPVPPVSQGSHSDPGRTVPTDEGPDAHDLAMDVNTVLAMDGESRYAHGEILGRGGMGEVRLTTDLRIGREVARKSVRSDHADTPEARARFLREAMVQGRLEHPAVVPVYDLGADADGDLYFTMRRVRGVTLHQVVRDLARDDPAVSAQWSRRKLLTAFSAVCLAVHYAHCQGVIHRDLKPANVMLGDFGEVYVIDWGLARRIADHPAPDTVPARAPREVTEAGRVMGSLGYMSPEQFAGNGAALDARSDVWALGAMLYEILTHHPLLEARNLVEAFSKMAHGLDVTPSHRVQGIPPELDAVCQRALTMDPSQRLPTARALAESVEKYLDGEQDVAYRRGLAAEHARAAETALARSFAGETPPAVAHDARVGAMRSLTAALALDPESPEARRGLFKLLTTEPDTVPAEAQAAMEDAQMAARLHALRVGARFMTLWLGCIPVAIALGILSWKAMAPAIALVVATVVTMHACAWRGRVSSRASVALLMLSSTAVATFSGWLGPFVLLPVAAAVNTMVFALYATPRGRITVAITAVLVPTVPFALQFLHMLPPAWRFDHGALVLLPRAIALPPRGTLAALMYTTVSLVVLPVFYVGAVRDALTAAQRSLFVRAWQLRQLIPEIPEKSSQP